MVLRPKYIIPFLFLLAVLAWAIVAESRMHLEWSYLDAEDGVDLLYSLAATFSAYYLFSTVLRQLKTRLSNMPSNGSWLIALAAASLLTYGWLFLFALLYSTYYYQVPMDDTSFFYEDSLMIALGLVLFGAIHWLDIDVLARDKADPPLKLQAMSGKRKLLVQPSEIALAFSKHKITHLLLQSGESCTIEMSLMELEALLPERDFFRLNRQVIAYRGAIRGYQPLPYQKLAVQLSTSHPDFQTASVSKPKAPELKRWLRAKHSADR